jgi:cytochrome c oxidase assembly factor 4
MAPSYKIKKDLPKYRGRFHSVYQAMLSTFWFCFQKFQLFVENYMEKEEEMDPFEVRIMKSGCYKEHVSLQDCHFELKDFRKCIKEMKEFKECWKKNNKHQYQ